MKHKIILYNPRAVFYTMPLSLIAIGSALDRTRFEVVLIDGRLERDAVATVTAACKDALCLGVSVLTGAPIRDAIEISRAAKKENPELTVVWGGWHPSLFPTEVLDEPTVDVSVQGQGEATFAELVERLVAGAGAEGVPGTACRQAQSRVRNPPRALVSMDELPRHDYRLIPVDQYFQLKQRRQFDYVSSTGCVFRCAFCADPFVYDRKWTAVSALRMGEELEEHWRRFEFEELAFQDETFFTYRERTAEIADQFLSRGLKFRWTATLRADQAVRMSTEIFDLCVRSGMCRVMVGVESGFQATLDLIQKDIKIEQVLETARMCRRRRVAAIFPFIIGFPGETPESVQATMDLIKKLKSMSERFDTPVFYFKPYPGSPITRDLTENGYRLPVSLDEWAEFDFIGRSNRWISAEQKENIERFKFYTRFAWGPERWFKRPLQWTCRWRCRRDFYRWPLEKHIVERLYPRADLS